MPERNKILIVEDNEVDYEAVERALAKAGCPWDLQWCRDSHDFYGYISDTRACNIAIILLDLSMPGVGGLQLLRDVRARDETRLIPVVVLSSSTDERDIAACYREGANTYVVKVSRPDGLASLMRLFVGYWRDLAELPPSHGS